MCRKVREPETLKALRVFQPRKLRLSDRDSNWNLAINQSKLEEINTLLVQFQSNDVTIRAFEDRAVKRLVKKFMKLQQQIDEVAAILAPIAETLDRYAAADANDSTVPSRAACREYVKPVKAGNRYEYFLREFLQSLEGVYLSAGGTNIKVTRSERGRKCGFVDFAYDLLEKVGKRRQSRDSLASIWEKTY